MIDHTDATANTLQVLEQLLEQSRVQWYEKVFELFGSNLEDLLQEEPFPGLVPERSQQPLKFMKSCH